VVSIRAVDTIPAVDYPIGHINVFAVCEIDAHIAIFVSAGVVSIIAVFALVVEKGKARGSELELFILVEKRSSKVIVATEIAWIPSIAPEIFLIVNFERLVR